MIAENSAAAHGHRILLVYQVNAGWRTMVTRSQGQPTPDQQQHARAKAVAWAAAMISNPNVVFLDTETTGLDGGAEIVEIAVVDGQGRPLLDTLVRPDGHIPQEVVRIHGIDDRMVRAAPHWAEVYRLVLPLLVGREVVVYNAAFDFRLVNQMNQRSGFPPLQGVWQCAMLQYAGFAAEPHVRYGGFRWHKLDVAVARFGQPPSGHRACADARACRSVVYGMAGITD
jgi:DNA polymerase-3 subunit epsilon